MQLFYCRQIEDGTAILDQEETRHCKVLRKSQGDTLYLIDGKGHLIEGSILSMGSAETRLSVQSVLEMPPSRSYRFHLYIAPTKQNERIEWMFEKAVEAGLDEISFIETRYSEKNRIKTERLERIAISAIKQSGQYYLPVIHPVRALNAVEFKSPALLAHCREDSGKQGLASVISTLPPDSEISILIGPEGDFSEEELRFLSDKGLQTVALGPNRLRTETAGLYCAMVLNAML